MEQFKRKVENVKIVKKVSIMRIADSPTRIDSPKKVQFADDKALKALKQVKLNQIRNIKSCHESLDPDSIEMQILLKHKGVIDFYKTQTENLT